MIFSDLLTIFKDMKPYVHTVTNPNNDIFGIMPFKDSVEFHFENNVLYVINKDSYSDTFSLITPPPPAIFDR